MARGIALALAAGCAASSHEAPPSGGWLRDGGAGCCGDGGCIWAYYSTDASEVTEICGD